MSICSLTSPKDGVRRIKVQVTEPNQALEEMQKLLLIQMIIPEKYNRAVLCNDGQVDNDFNDPRCYPLKFLSRSGNEELWFSGVSAGDNGAGAHAIFQLLMLMDFKKMKTERDISCLKEGEKKVFWR